MEEFVQLSGQLGFHVAAQERRSLGVCGQDACAQEGKRSYEFVKEAAGAFIDTENAFEIEDEIAKGREVLEDVADDRLRRGKGQLALHLVDSNGVTRLAQCLALL